MPTRAERTALVFLAAVLVAGGIVRLGRAVASGRAPDASAATALARHQQALDSAAQARRAKATGSTAATAQTLQRSATPPPERPPPHPARTPPVVNVNRASAAELDALPRVGPAIAARIVAERDANGPFTSLAALEARVRGIGPALARTIDTLIRF